MVGEKGANRTTRRGEWVTHGSKGKVEGRITWQEEDPHGLNTEQLRGRDVRTPLIRALRSWPLKDAPMIPDPPPRLKGRKAGGVRNGLRRH